MSSILRELSYDLRRLLRYRKYKDRQNAVRTVELDGGTYVYTLRDFVSNECIFVHVPKAAGISVNTALFGHLAGGHQTVRDYRLIFGRRFWSYYKFTFVRNPYSRLVSTYEYLKNGGNPSWPSNRDFCREVIDSYNGFSDFVLKWLLPEKTQWPKVHFYPQVHFLTIDGTISVNFVGCVERIENDFGEVCQKLNIKAALPIRNRTRGNRRPVQEYYDKDAVIRRVQDVYRSDFESFGYSLDVDNVGRVPCRLH